MSVCGTGAIQINNSGFSWELLRLLSLPASLPCTIRFCSWADLPTQSTHTPFNQLFRLLARLSLLRLHFSLYASHGILTVSSIHFAFRLHVRTRLTLMRLALIRNPQSSGERVSHPLYRYLYLHLLFQTLQSTLRYAFYADWNAPLPIACNHMASVDNLCPIIIHAPPLD